MTDSFAILTTWPTREYGRGDLRVLHDSLTSVIWQPCECGPADLGVWQSRFRRVIGQKYDMTDSRVWQRGFRRVLRQTYTSLIPHTYDMLSRFVYTTLIPHTYDMLSRFVYTSLIPHTYDMTYSSVWHSRCRCVHERYTTVIGKISECDVVDWLEV